MVRKSYSTIDTYGLSSIHARNNRIFAVPTIVWKANALALSRVGQYNTYDLETLGGKFYLIATGTLTKIEVVMSV